MGLAITAVVAELFIFTFWVGSVLMHTFFGGAAALIFAVFLLPPVALVCALLAVIVGHRARDVWHRRAFWIGLGALVLAGGGLLGTVVFMIAEVQSGG